MKKRLGIPLLIAVFLIGCQPPAPLWEKSAAKKSTMEGTVEKSADISYSPIVCKYTSRTGYGTPVDCITANIQINDDDTVTVFYSDFLDRADSETIISLDYIYGETFDITEDQKQDVITAIQENNILHISECGDESSCDGGYCYIYLFNGEGEAVHSCGGFNPYIDEFRNTETAIREVLPDHTLKDIHNKAEKVLIKYLLDNYPDRYGWLDE